LQKNCIEQAEDRFGGDPGWHGVARPIMRWHKFPAANGLFRALVKPQPDSLDDSDLRGSPVSTDENAQYHSAL